MRAALVGYGNDAGVRSLFVVRVTIVAGRKCIGLGLVGERCGECTVCVLGDGDAVAGHSHSTRFGDAIGGDSQLHGAGAGEGGLVGGDVDGGGGLIDNQRSSDSGTRIIIISLRRSQADLDDARLSNGRDIALSVAAPAFSSGFSTSA